MKTSRDSPAKSIRLKSEIVCAAGWNKCERLRTIVVRFGNGFPRDSKVFRPITMTWPVVIFLNHLKSSGRCQGIRLPRPMTRFSDMAAMALKCFMGWSSSFSLSVQGSIVGTTRRLNSNSHCNRRFDGGVRVVAVQFEILVVKFVNVLHRRVEFHSRQRTRLARELQLRLVDVVGVKVKVAEGVHERARLEVTNLRDHQ